MSSDAAFLRLLVEEVRLCRIEWKHPRLFRQLSEIFEKQRAFSVPRSCLKINEDHVNVILKPLITSIMMEKRK